MKRVQRKRVKGYKTPENTKYVGRPTKWGNPFRVEELGAKEAVKRYRECVLNNTMCYAYISEEIEANKQFYRFKWISENLQELSGMDLSCFCSLDYPCHADALIELIEKQKYL